jgi:hypothetical protein
MIDLESLMDQLEEAEALLLEPREFFDEALLGISDSAQGQRVAVYEIGKCIAALMKGYEWDFETAQEWFEFNTIGAYVGEGTPLFLDLLVRD